MSRELHVEGRSVVITFSGFDKWVVFSGPVHLPFEAITSVRVVGWQEVRDNLGWRTMGGYWPGRFATGWYAVPETKGLRQLLAVFRNRDALLCIDTTLGKPCRVVLEVDDPHAMAATINQQLSPL